MRILKAGDVALGFGAPYSNEELSLFLEENASDDLDLNLEESIDELKSLLS